MRKIDGLQDQIDDLREDIKYLMSRVNRLDSEFDERVDENIKNKIYIRTVENLDNYRKGKELEKPLKTIKEILK